MKFSCKTKDILQSVSLVSRAIGGQQTLPILGNILFQVEGKRCTLSATNLEFSIISYIDADVENEGSITIPAKAISNFSQYATGEDVLFESVEESQIKCSTKKVKTIIAGESAGDYPTISPIQKEASFTADPQELLQAIYHTTFASARTTTRPVLSGVYTKISKNELILVSTDSYRLSEYRVPVKNKQGEVECIVPAKVFMEVMSIISGLKKDNEKDSDESESQEEIAINLSAQQIEVVVGKTTILSRLIDGTFPKYEQIIPESSKTSLSVPLGEFLAHVKRMHYFAKESNNNLTFNIKPDSLHIKTQPTQYGRDESEIQVSAEGGENKIALSSAYLLDFLTHVSGEQIRMEMIDKTRPAVFRLPDQSQFLHLIMPLRLNEEDEV